MSLPIFLPDDQNPSRPFSMMQTQWASQLNPLLRGPLSSGSVLKNIVLASGSNVVNHKLGRDLQGWFVTRQRGLASLYDTQDTNQSPGLTLTLVSSAGVTVDLYVF